LRRPPNRADESREKSPIFAGRIVPGGVGLFYYAGHGMHVRGANYLLPVDAILGSEFDLKYETLDVNDVLSRLDDARAP
jgi:hypothetical protein